MKVLVHDCGHIIKPGDTIECVELSKITAYGRQFKFVGMYELDPALRCVRALPLDPEVRRRLTETHNDPHVVWWPERFNCSIMEIQDDTV